MSFTFKKKYLLFSTILLCLFIILFFIAHLWLDRVIKSKINDTAQNSGIRTEIKSAEINFPLNLEINNLGISLPPSSIYPLPFPLFISKISTNLKFLPLIFAELRAKINIRLYKGQINSIISKKFWGAEAKGIIKAKKIQIENHPLFKSIGLRGLFSFKITKLILSDNINESSGKFILKLDSANYDGGKIYGIFDIPPISNINLTVRGEKKANVFFIEKIFLNSSLGNLKGKGRIDLDIKSNLSRVNINGHINLSEQGAIILSPYFSLLNNPPIAQEQVGNTHWQFGVTKNTANSPLKYLFSPK